MLQKFSPSPHAVQTCVNIHHVRQFAHWAHVGHRRAREETSEGGRVAMDRTTGGQERGGMERCRGSMGAEISHCGDGGMDE